MFFIYFSKKQCDCGVNPTITLFLLLRCIGRYKISNTLSAISFSIVYIDLLGEFSMFFATFFIVLIDFVAPVGLEWGVGAHPADTF